MGDRLKTDRLLESDVFFLKRYLKDLFIMAKYDFKFILSALECAWFKQHTSILPSISKSIGCSVIFKRR